MVTQIQEVAEEADLDYLLTEIPKSLEQSLDGVPAGRENRSVDEGIFTTPGRKDMQAIDLNRALESTVTVCRNEWKYVADMVS